MSNIISGTSYYQGHTSLSVTSLTFTSSGTSWLETEEETVKRVRKEIRELREKKIKRISGSEADTEQVVTDTG